MWLVYLVTYFIVIMATATALAGPAVATPHHSVSQSRLVTDHSAATSNPYPGERNLPGEGSGTPIGTPIHEERAGVPVRLLFYLLLACGAALTVKGAFSTAKVISMDGLNKMRFRKFRQLSPMVTRSLEIMGTSLWGKNRLWAKNFSITRESDRWLLRDGGRELIFHKSEVKNCVEVCLRDTNLKVRIRLLNGQRTDKIMECMSFSEEGLVECLEEARVCLSGKSEEYCSTSNP
jgi:hypothetical protein